MQLNLIYILFIVEVVFFFLAYFLLGRDIMAPSVIFCVMFCISIGLSLTMIDQWEINYSPEGFLILTSGTLVFVITEVLFRHFALRGNTIVPSDLVDQQRYEMKPIAVQTWIIAAIVIFDIITYIWYCQEIIRIMGYGGMTAFSDYRELRAHFPDPSKEGLETTGFLLNQCIRIANTSSYIFLFIFINNCLSGEKKGKILLLGIAAFFPQGIYFFAAARSGMIKFASAALIELYILCNRRAQWNRNLSRKFIIVGGACGLIGAGFLYFGLPLFGRKTSTSLLQYLAKYAGSGIQLFDLFLKDPVYPHAFGEETFIGIRVSLSRLGLPVYVKDVNLEFRDSGLLNSNIYTFFRRPLHDFGLIGMYIFTVLVSLLFSYIYYKKIRNKEPSVKADLWILTYGYLYYWIISASTVQRSEAYLAAGAFADLFVILGGYLLLLKAPKVHVRR